MNWDILGLWPSHSPISRLLLLTNHHCIAKRYTWDPFMCGVPCPSQPCKISTWSRKHQQALSENSSQNLLVLSFLHIFAIKIAIFGYTGIPGILCFQTNPMGSNVNGLWFDYLYIFRHETRQPSYVLRQPYQPHSKTHPQKIIFDKVYDKQLNFKHYPDHWLSSFIYGSHSSILSKKNKKINLCVVFSGAKLSVNLRQP